MPPLSSRGACVCASSSPAQLATDFYAYTSTSASILASSDGKQQVRRGEALWSMDMEMQLGRMSRGMDHENLLESFIVFCWHYHLGTSAEGERRLTSQPPKPELGALRMAAATWFRTSSVASRRLVSYMAWTSFQFATTRAIDGQLGSLSGA